MNAGSKIKNRMQKLRGTLRRKNAKGSFYYRLTVANGVRKEFALKTTDELEALQRAEELDSIWAAPTCYFRNVGNRFKISPAFLHTQNNF